MDEKKCAKFAEMFGSVADQVRDIEIEHLRATLLAVRGPYCWCRIWYHGQPHTPACIAAQKLTGVEYGEDK